MKTKTVTLKIGEYNTLINALYTHRDEMEKSLQRLKGAQKKDTQYELRQTKKIILKIFGATDEK